MRIAIVTDSFKPRVGGIESFLADYTKTLAGRHEVVVITSAGNRVGSGSATNGKNGLQVSLEDKVEVVRLPRSYLEYRGVTLNPRAIAIMSKTLKAIDPDVVHGHGLYSTLAISGTYAAWRYLRKPTVLTAHSFLDKDTPEYLVFGLRLAARNLGVLTAVSRALAEELQKRLKPARIAVTYNCLVCREWESVDGDELDGDPAVVSVLRLTHRKNPLALLLLAEELAREAPRARLYIVGDGDLRGLIEKRVKSRGLKNVVFLGALERSRVARVLKGGHIFVLPSRTEAFGLSALEAMATGLPVVAMSVGGLPEVVSHGESGLLAGSTQELVSHTITLATDETLRKRLSAGALQRARLFDCEHLLPRYLAVYMIAERVLAESR